MPGPSFTGGTAGARGVVSDQHSRAYCCYHMRRVSLARSASSRPNPHWAEREAHRVAMEIRRLRATHDQSAQWLAERPTELGSPVTRTVIADIENGRRRYITTAELAVFAAALNTAPIASYFLVPMTVRRPKWFRGQWNGFRV